MSDIEAGVKYRKEGYRDECLKRGVLSADGTVLKLSDEDHAYIRQHFGTGYPSFRQMAKTATEAAARAGAAAVKGEPVYATEEKFQQRLATCNGCEWLDKAAMRCGKCGCFVEKMVVGKCRLETEKCPVGKW